MQLVFKILTEVTSHLLGQILVAVAGETVYHTAPIPFGQNEFVSFKFTINPAPGQYNLTGVPEFGARVYKINLIVKDSQNVVDWNTDPID